jgi:hypothetical protein
MTDEPNGRLSPTEVTALITLIDARLGRMEDRIIARLDLNSAGAAERWLKHDAELAVNTKRVVDRFALLETALDKHVVAMDAHLIAAHDAELISAARIAPVKLSLGYAEKHWRTFLLWVVMILTLMGVGFGRLLDLGLTGP